MRQSDIARAIRAALSEGLTIDRIEVENERVVFIISTPERRDQKAAEKRVSEAHIAAAAAAAHQTARELIELGKKRSQEEKNKQMAWAQNHPK